MSLVPQQNAFLKDVVSLLQYAWEQGFVVTGGELYRTREQQGIYYAWGRTKTMNSNHLKRLALDLNFFRNDNQITRKEDLQELGDYWVDLSDNNRWGGNWSFYDPGHFERIEQDGG